MTRPWIPPEPVARKAHAEKIHAILCDYLQSDLSKKKCLEVGCGIGEITYHLAKQIFQIIGVEINGQALRSNLFNDNKVNYVQGDGRQLPFEDNTFDIVVLAQVYEHMTGQEMLSAEIYRVLKSGGVCFFSGPNRWQVVEPHYFLPFLAWLPHRMADKYLQLSGRGSQFDIYPRGYWGIKRLWRRFKIKDYTWQMLKDPEKFDILMPAFLARILRITPVYLIKLMRPFYRNYNWILVK